MCVCLCVFVSMCFRGYVCVCLCVYVCMFVRLYLFVVIFAYVRCISVSVVVSLPIYVWYSHAYIVLLGLGLEGGLEQDGDGKLQCFAWMVVLSGSDGSSRCTHTHAHTHPYTHTHTHTHTHTRTHTHIHTHIHIHTHQFCLKICLEWR